MLERPIKEIIDEALEVGVFGADFTFRKGQRETIETIIQTYQEDPESTVVIDAPTGTGKSIIAMWCAWIFKEMGKKGYLVTSDLSLQDQYESDLKKLRLRWPSIKGIDNYDCHVNGLKFSLGECRMRNMGYEQALAKMKCAQTCEYIQLRKRAIDSPVSVLNYAFWLLQRNYVAPKMESDEREVPFKKRDYVFFDEAHKIDEIVQNHFSPRVDNFLPELLNNQAKFLVKSGLASPNISSAYLNDLIGDLLHSQDREVLYAKLIELKKVLTGFNASKSAAEKSARQIFGTSVDRQLSPTWKTAFNRFDRIKDIHCKIEDYIDLINITGIDTMVFDQRDDEAKFMCTEEATMIQKYLHKQSGFKIFMSATIGGPREFARIMGITSAKFVRLDNAFNYDKSPVVFINKHKLSYREKETSLPKVIKLLDKIIEKHKGQRGIIHTGSYEFTKYIKQHSKHTFRLMDYDNSKEKNDLLELFKQKEEAVFMGPSLLEGLDLKDDVSRFQIFFKVPYPNLGDPLIKAKMNTMPNWYDWKTGITIMQGVGRSVRNEDDWAVTYILDACFLSLINKPELFPPSFVERVKTIK
jgi:ATP-dependent DNA helicase DinG